MFHGIPKYRNIVINKMLFPKSSLRIVEPYKYDIFNQVNMQLCSFDFIKLRQ